MTTTEILFQGSKVTITDVQGDVIAVELTADGAVVCRNGVTLGGLRPYSAAMRRAAACDEAVPS